MYMVSEQVKELRKYAGFFKDDRIDGNLSPIFKNAADTIEALSANLQAANMKNDGGWIPCEDRLPDKTGTYLTTSRIYFVPDHVDEPDNYIGVEMTRFSEKFGWSGEEVFAWQPLPEPYRT